MLKQVTEETRKKMSLSQRKRQGSSLARFFAKVDFDGPISEFIPEEFGPCWVWQGSHSWNGYGQFEDGRAHVWSYTNFVGPVPVGKELDHRCRTRDCVHYLHLEAVTRSVNIRRAVAARKQEESWRDSSTW